MNIIPDQLVNASEMVEHQTKREIRLSISDAIRLLMLRVAEEHRLPFEVKVPNATTRKAITELEVGKGEKFTSIEALMNDLHADD